MRAPKENDFFVDLDGVGKFRFGRKTIGDRCRIRAQYIGLLGGIKDDEMLDDELGATAAMIASYSVMCVSCPKGWEDLETMDGTDQSITLNMFKLFGLWRDTEDSFRLGSKADRQEPVTEG